ncbi:hypothetical protein AB0I10_36800 [Streptomyces sp. NPDC050636]|uniref:RNA polymerase sigma factor n=1 Tax=Streptomyces sp. NPDC050636 TaxID=3154510 RepID=UPI0034122C74
MHLFPGTRQSQQPLSDVALIYAVRKGQVELFRYIYRRHYAAVQAYASQCVPDPLHAFELTSQVFAQLLQRMLSAEPFVELRHLGCLRRQLLDSVRSTAITRWERVPLSPEFKAWVAAGCLWPLDEDGQLPLAYLRLPTTTQCLLWHSVVDQDDPAITARVTGLTRQSVPSMCDEAKSALRQARTELYLERLGRQDCIEVIKQLALGPETPPAEESASHLRRCPACLRVYKDVSRLDARMQAQLPVRLLGWWPGEKYLLAKAAIPVPLDDPPFLARLMDQPRTRVPAQRSHARRAAATVTGRGGSTASAPSQAPRSRATVAAIGFLVGIGVGMGTLAACTHQSEAQRNPQNGTSPGLRSAPLVVERRPAPPPRIRDDWRVRPKNVASASRSHRAELSGREPDMRVAGRHDDPEVAVLVQEAPGGGS